MSNVTEFIKVNINNGAALGPRVPATRQFSITDNSGNVVTSSPGGLIKIAKELREQHGYYPYVREAPAGDVVVDIFSRLSYANVWDSDAKVMRGTPVVSDMAVASAKTTVAQRIVQMRDSVRNGGMAFTGNVVTPTGADTTGVYKVGVSRDHQNDLMGIVQEMAEDPTLENVHFKIAEGTYIVLEDVAAAKALKTAGFRFIQAIYTKEAELTAIVNNKQKITTIREVHNDLDNLFVVDGMFVAEGV